MAEDVECFIVEVKSTSETVSEVTWWSVPSQDKLVKLEMIRELLQLTQPAKTIDRIYGNTFFTHRDSVRGSRGERESKEGGKDVRRKGMRGTG